MFTPKPLKTSQNTQKTPAPYRELSQEKPEIQKIPSSFQRNFLWGFLVIILMCIGFAGVHIYRSLADIEFTFGVPQAIISLVWETIRVDIDKEIVETTSMKQSIDGKTNFLIIGRGGVENEAPNLTDSILLASLHYDKKSFSLLSIPRDLYVSFPTGGKGKINEAYFRGLRAYDNDEDQAMDNLGQIVSNITGEDVHYYVNLDFEGFRKIIDILWGIEVDVPKALVDYEYPGPNFSYQTFRISAWPQTLDGATALKYARSRHSTSDFDRSLRQQLIIKGVREKAFSLGFLTDIGKMRSVYATLSEDVKTNLNIGQLLFLATQALEIPKDHIVSSNFNDTCFSETSVCEKWWMLYAPSRDLVGGMAVMLMEGTNIYTLSNYSKIAPYTNIVFNFPLTYAENKTIYIYNSTKLPGIAAKTQQKLRSYGFTFPPQSSGTGLSGTTDDVVYEQSKIFYTSANGEKPETVRALESFFLGGSERVPALKYTTDPGIEIEIVLGNDYKNLSF